MHPVPRLQGERPGAAAVARASGSLGTIFPLAGFVETWSLCLYTGVFGGGGGGLNSALYKASRGDIHAKRFFAVRMPVTDSPSDHKVGVGGANGLPMGASAQAATRTDPFQSFSGVCVSMLKKLKYESM